MKNRILVLRNRLPYQITNDFEKLATWLPRNGIDVQTEYTYRDVDFAVTFAKSTWTYAGVKGASVQTLANMQDVARNFVRKGEFDTCIFIWDVDEVPFSGERFFTNTDYYDKQLDLMFISVASRRDWESKQDDVYRVVTHEDIHVFYAKLAAQGIHLADTIDTYREEFLPDSKTGNRAENLERLRPYFPRIFPDAPKIPQTGGLAQMLASLIRQVLGLQKELEGRKKLINALVQVESGGNDYAIGDLNLKHKAYGPLQIRQPYMDDVFPNRKAQECLGNRKLSIEVFEQYMERYATKALIGREVTDEDRARIHNGGPSGWKRASTKPYWEKVKKLL